MNEGHYWAGEDLTVFDLDHLHESARSVVRLPAQERLRHVRADRWIGYTRATAALERLEFRHPCSRLRKLTRATIAAGRPVS